MFCLSTVLFSVISSETVFKQALRKCEICMSFSSAISSPFANIVC